MANGLRFDENYREQVTTREGEALTLRLVRPTDKEKLLLGFAQLSARSRYFRFFASKKALTEEELRFFTETDCMDHFAIGALERLADGSEGRGVGVARFIRNRDQADMAEVAITVVDDMQQRGVGSLLLDRLVHAAQERGIEHFRFECLAQNREVQRLVRSLCEQVEMVAEDEVMIATVRLPEPEKRAGEDVREFLSGLYDLFRAVARDALHGQLALGFGALDRTLDAIQRNGPLSDAEGKPQNELKEEPD